MAESRRLIFALAALASVMVAGTVGYLLLGFGLLDALYQTVTTVSTVGFREVQPLHGAGKVFTIALILVGVGTALYAFGVLIETLLEGQLQRSLRETPHGTEDRSHERPRRSSAAGGASVGPSRGIVAAWAPTR